MDYWSAGGKSLLAKKRKDGNQPTRFLVVRARLVH